MKEGVKMGKAATRAKNKYNAENYERIALSVPKGQKEAIKAHAESNGESVNGFINRAIMEVTEMDQMHRAYQRGLLRHLEKLSAALDSEDIIESKKLLFELIEDTQNSI